MGEFQTTDRLVKNSKKCRYKTYCFSSLFNIHLVWKPFVFPYIYIYEGGLKSSYNDVIFGVDVFFLSMVSKHCRTNGKSAEVESREVTMLKNKPYLVTFQKSITLSKSSWWHPLSAQSWCKSLLLGQHWYLSSSLLYQLCPKRLVRLTRMVCEMGGKWSYNCCFVGCCFKKLFKTTCSILG